MPSSELSAFFVFISEIPPGFVLKIAGSAFKHALNFAILFFTALSSYQPEIRGLKWQYGASLFGKGSRSAS
jgi:hypothetical protein